MDMQHHQFCLEPPSDLNKRLLFKKGFCDGRCCLLDNIWPMMLFIALYYLHMYHVRMAGDGDPKSLTNPSCIIIHLTAVAICSFLLLIFTCVNVSFCQLCAHETVYKW